MAKIAKNQISLDFSIGEVIDYSQLDANTHYYTENTTKKQLNEVFSKILKQTNVAFDLETEGEFHSDSLRPWKGAIRLVQLGCADGEVYIFDRKKLRAPMEILLREHMRTFLGNKKIKKITHNGKFDFVWCLYWLGKNTPINNCFDTYITSTMLYSGLFLSGSSGSSVPLVKLGLGHCVERETGVKINKDQQNSAWGNVNLSLDQINYAATDVRVLFPLKEALQKKFTGRAKYCAEVENHAVAAIARMEANGFRIDVEKTKKALKIHKDLHAEKLKPFHKKFPGQKTGGSGLLACVNNQFKEELEKEEYDELFEYGAKDSKEHKKLKDDRILPRLTDDVLAVLGKFEPALASLSDARTIEKSINYLENMLLCERNRRVYTSYGQLSLSSIGRTSSKSAVSKKNKGTAADGINLQNCSKPVPGIPYEYSARACFQIDIISDLASAHRV